jgi:hypothetical protein
MDAVKLRCSVIKTVWTLRLDGTATVRIDRRPVRDFLVRLLGTS